MTSLLSAVPLADGVQDLMVEVDAPSAREAVAAAIVSAGFGLLEMTETRADLERLFLEFTNRAAP